MRTLSSAIEAEVAKKLGTEPVNILEVQWVTDGPFLLYADKDIDTTIKGKILEISTLESVIKLDFQGQSQGISVVLSDTESDLKDIFDNHNLHGKVCRLFQWFEGLPLDERFKLYEGQISSPIQWHEGDRTISFEVITQLEDKEVGFSPEEGYFPFIPTDKIGVAWPFVFGNVQNVPAVRITAIPTTQIVSSLGVADPTLPDRIGILTAKKSELQELARWYALAALQALHSRDSATDPAEISTFDSIAQQMQNALNQVLLLLANVDLDLAKTQGIFTSQLAKQSSSVNLSDVSGFVDGDSRLKLQASNIILDGTFSGNVFNISALNLSDFLGFEDGDDPFGFTFIREGATITLQNDSPIIYIINILPSTVDFVQVFKQGDNGKALVSVSADLYTVIQEDIGPYTITYLSFPKALSSIDPTFEDEVFVTLTSSVGPNTVDILEFLITTYTDLAIDTASFATVKIQLANYPSNFALLDRRNIFALLEDIAFQSRCAIWISGGIFFIRYLAEEASSTASINEGDIDSGKLKIFTTTSEDIVTKLVATWRDDLSDERRNKIILRHNVNIYGTKEREIEFFIYNIDELVLKSATFWLIRLANVWKHVKFTTFLHKLAIETFDVINFNFSNPFISTGDIKGRITSAVFNSDEQTIDMEAWLPIKIGTMVRYNFAEPKDIAITLLFPTDDEIKFSNAGGDGIGQTAESTLNTPQRFLTSLGHQTRSQREANGERIQGDDFGDEVPSDVDDLLTQASFTTYDLEPSEEPVFDYEYPAHDLDIKFDEPDADFSYSFPGKVILQLASDSYSVEVYTLGLANDPTTQTVKQLQIEAAGIIPVGTWVMVGFNRWTEEEGDDTVEKSEYTMQVPVWL